MYLLIKNAGKLVTKVICQPDIGLEDLKAVYYSVLSNVCLTVFQGLG
jgi:hypothetical protein